MKQFDPGPGAMGLAVLATALAVLLTAGVPIAVSGESVKISDWLGFAGNVLGSGTALIAAIAAWRAVQRQIKAQETIASRQLATAAMEVLIRQSELLEAEAVLVGDVKLIVQFIRLAVQMRFSPQTLGYRGAIVALVADTEKHTDEISRFRKELDATNTRSWTLPTAQVDRVQMKTSLMEVSHALSGIKHLTQYPFSDVDYDQDAEIRSRFEAFAVPAKLDNAIASCGAYFDRLSDASLALNGQLQRTRREMGL